MNAIQDDLLWEIAGKFTIQGNILSITPYGNGHINDTFFVTTDISDHPGYILQRINHHVFKNIDGLMSNMQIVTDHLNSKPGKLVWPELIKTADCRLWTANWRMMTFIQDGISHESVKSTKMALEAGKALGEFQRLLSDLPASTLVETIPDFHLLSPRLKTFEAAVQNDPAGRVKDVPAEIQFVRDLSGEMSLLENLGKEKKLPVRITHNDTKINNILFNKNDEAISIIDLDTVMPGFVLYDFGDAIRTGANAAREDERDLQKVIFRKDIFDAYLEGYLSEATGFLTDLEMDMLPFSAMYMTYLIGLRFLTDYLAGDVYYKTSYPEHNLIRARVQFCLLGKM